MGYVIVPNTVSITTMYQAIVLGMWSILSISAVLIGALIDLKVEVSESELGPPNTCFISFQGQTPTSMCVWPGRDCCKAQEMIIVWVTSPGYVHYWIVIGIPLS